MYKRLLNFLCCPQCNGSLEAFPLAYVASSDEEFSEGLLSCTHAHWYPVVRRIPRMLPDALAEHRETIKPLLRNDGRRGFGACGRLSQDMTASAASRETTGQAESSRAALPSQPMTTASAGMPGGDA